MNVGQPLCRHALRIAISSLLLPAPAFAQSQAAATIEEIVVTAQKRSESAQEIGISIDAWTGDTLRDRGVLTAEDMARLTPGLMVTQSAATGVPNYTIRGVGFNDYSTAASSTVGLYLDEVSIPYTVASRGAIFDVERVEVLKGPQGDLYGRNTTAGQINFISRRPTTETEAGVTATWGRFQALDLEGYFSGGLGERAQGRVAYKVTNQGEGWQRSVTRPGDTLGEKDLVALRGLVNFNLSDSLDLLVNVHYVRDQSENQAATAYRGTAIGLAQDQQLPTIGTPSFSLNDNRAADWSDGVYYPQRDNELKGASVTLSWDFAAATLTSITAWDEFTRSEGNDWDGSAIRDSSNLNVTDLEVVSQELRLASTGEGPWSWIAGLYWSHDEMDEAYNYFMEDSFYSLALGIRTLDTLYRQETDSAAVFGHAEWQFAESWKLVAGMRYTREERDFSGCTYDTGDGSLAGGLNNIITPFLVIPAGLPDPGPVLPGACGVYNDVPGSPGYGTYSVFSDGIESNRTMWKLALNWKPADDVLVYAGVSKGFKSGGFNGANANTHSQIVPYRPESLLAWELGVKSTLLDRRLQLNSSVFYYDYKDKQEGDFFVTFVGAIGGIANVPESEITGVDFDLQWTPVPGLSLGLGAAYLDAKIKSWMSVNPSSVFGQPIQYLDQSGRRLSNAPRWQTNASVGYEWDLSDALRMSVGVDYAYKDDTSAPNAFQEADSYGIADARVGIASRDERWSTTLWVRNVADSYYYVSAFLGGNGPYVRMLGMPRTWGVTFNYRFF